MSVGIVVNCYERTYREVLAPGFFSAIVRSNRRDFAEVVALINNVENRDDAVDRAESLLRAGEITSYVFVSDHLARALHSAHLSSRALRRRPYLLDYGLVMPHVVGTDWLLGWDAETVLERPTNWVDPAIELMASDRRVFHSSLNWPPAVDGEAGLDVETVETVGDFALNWGFSDQLFLIRRSNLIGPIFRSFAPTGVVRHAPHPYTFEARVEMYQRAHRRYRATMRSVTYGTNHMNVGVIERTGRGPLDAFQVRLLRKVELRVINKLPSSLGPRFSKP